jgi:hypothetical protein
VVGVLKLQDEYSVRQYALLCVSFSIKFKGVFMINFTKRLINIAIVINLGISSIANGAVVLNSYANPDNGGYYILGANGSKLAIAFTVTDSITIDNIQTGIQGTGAISLQLTSEVSGLPSPIPLYSLALNNPVADTLHSGLGWVLSPGQYFLTETADSGFDGGWVNTLKPGISWLFSPEPALTWYPPDFQAENPPTALITTSVVPIPAAFWLLGSALMGLVSRRKNKVNALNPWDTLGYAQKNALVKISPQNVIGVY